jgi:hypothetical protein
METTMGSMTDEIRLRRQEVERIVKRTSLRTALFTAVLAAAAFAFPSIYKPGPEGRWFVPAGILAGGALGLMNFRWLAAAVERVYLRKGTTPRLASVAAFFVSGLRLSIIFVILFVVIKWRLLDIFSLVAGLSSCFLAIMWEGAASMKHMVQNGDG